ncbi:MAG: hypothetical protein ACFFG0_26540 [Candidatus Thorarchaeota archaeon]
MKDLKKFIPFILITLLIIVILFQIGIRVYAQENEPLEITGLKYSMYEYADKIDLVNNTQSIEIDLPSDMWNATKLELNFTDIKLGQEIKDFDEFDTGFKVIEKFSANYGYGVQINISEPTTLYATYIYGFKSDYADEVLEVQINGYDPVKNAPNDIIYGTSIDLNITKNLGWFYQKFENQINLSIGKYFLVVYSSNILSPQDKYYWGYNAYSQYPNLYVSRYDGNTWSDGIKNSTLLYKLVQSTERIYKPQDINMTIEIENKHYNILNGKNNGTGYVKISNLSYSSDKSFLQIPIKCNISITLNFSYSCFLRIKNEFDAEGSVTLVLEQEIKWRIEPSIIRKENNYSVKFFYFENWNNIEIYRNDVLINSELNVIINTDEKFIYIKNESILIGATWLITALSSQEILNINFPINQFEPNQELRCSLEIPQINGNISWRLIDPWGFELFNETKVVISELTILSYHIPENPHEGDYKVVILWYNDHQASMTSQDIKIIVPFTLSPQFIILIVIIFGIIATGSTLSYISVKKVRNKVQLNRKKLVDKCGDVLSMNYFMVIDKNSGLCVYEEPFSATFIDSALISGFLDAIRSFGIELTGSYQQSQTVKLEYKDSKILMVEFKNFRLVIIMSENPSTDFLKSITDLSYEIDKEYGHLLSNFKNDVLPFKGIKMLVKKYLNTSFLAPLKIVENKNLKLNSAEKNEYNRALEFMKKNHLEYFFTSFLLKKHEYEPSKIKAIFNLIEKNIFQLYNVEMVEIPKENIGV